MSRPFEPGTAPAGLAEALGATPDALSPNLVDDGIYFSCELVERYSTDLALDLASRLALTEPLRAGATLDGLLAARGFVPAFAPALAALLARLAAAGFLEQRDSDGATVWRLAGDLPAAELDLLRNQGTAFDPNVAATLDLLDAAAEAWPRVASGAASGEQELFAPARIALWIAYFSNTNPAYVISNRIPAAVAARRLRPGGGLRILEVGAGAGSFASALLAELAARGRLGDVALYDFTEPSPFFRRRGERQLCADFPELPLRARALDLNAETSFAAPEDDGAPYDLVVGVNVFHVAVDLVGALRRTRELLAPGGWLVAGECMRLFPGQPVPADLIFELLSSFSQVRLDPANRPRHGFLEPEDWRRSLAAAGFAEPEVVPDLARIRTLYPRFFSAAAVGRR